MSMHLERGTLIVMTAEATGDDHCGAEWTTPIGAHGRIERLRDDGGIDYSVMAGIAEDGTDAWICQTWHPSDGDMPFRRAPAARTADDPDAAQPSDPLSDRERQMLAALRQFVIFHSGHVLPPVLQQAMAEARAIIDASKGESGA